MYSQGKTYVLPRETTSKKRENEKWKSKKSTIEKTKNIKSQIQCFLEESICFFEREKWKI